MKVCAHICVAPFQFVHERHDSVKSALASLREWDESTFGSHAGEPEEYPEMNLYPQCADCDSMMNFHDWPMATYRIGPRGGLRRSTH